MTIERAIKEKQSHIAWNYETRLSDLETNQVRYYILVFDDTEKEKKLNEIIENSQSSGIHYPFNPIPTLSEPKEIKIRGIKQNILLAAYDTAYAPHIVDPSNIYYNVYRDKKLYEKENESIEDYVQDMYQNLVDKMKNK